MPEPAQSHPRARPGMLQVLFASVAKSKKHKEIYYENSSKIYFCCPYYWLESGVIILFPSPWTLEPFLTKVTAKPFYELIVPVPHLCLDQFYRWADHRHNRHHSQVQHSQRLWASTDFGSRSTTHLPESLLRSEVRPLRVKTNTIVLQLKGTATTSPGV